MYTIDLTKLNLSDLASLANLCYRVLPSIALPIESMQMIIREMINNAGEDETRKTLKSVDIFDGNIDYYFYYVSHK
jgi:hypothetical protein